MTTKQPYRAIPDRWKGLRAHRTCRTAEVLLSELLGFTQALTLSVAFVTYVLLIVVPANRQG